MNQSYKILDISQPQEKFSIIILLPMLKLWVSYAIKNKNLRVLPKGSIYSLHKWLQWLENIWIWNRHEKFTFSPNDQLELLPGRRSLWQKLLENWLNCSLGGLHCYVGSLGVRVLCKFDSLGPLGLQLLFIIESLGVRLLCVVDSQGVQLLCIVDWLGVWLPFCSFGSLKLVDEFRVFCANLDLHLFLKFEETFLIMFLSSFEFWLSKLTEFWLFDQLLTCWVDLWLENLKYFVCQQMGLGVVSD